jgi:hypothetical protein
MSSDLRQKACAALTSLHAKGVIHGDCGSIMENDSQLNAIRISNRVVVGISLDRLEMSSDLKQKACAALTSLQAKGVIHGDCALRNLVYRECVDKVLLVEFDCAEFREDMGEAQFERLAEMEYCELEKQLSLRLKTAR